MKKKPPHDPASARKARLAERDGFERRLAKAYKDDAPKKAVKASINASDKIASKLYPNG